MPRVNSARSAELSSAQVPRTRASDKSAQTQALPAGNRPVRRAHLCWKTGMRQIRVPAHERSFRRPAGGHRHRLRRYHRQARAGAGGRPHRARREPAHPRLRQRRRSARGHSGKHRRSARPLSRRTGGWRRAAGNRGQPPGDRPPPHQRLGLGEPPAARHPLAPHGAARDHRKRRQCHDLRRVEVRCRARTRERRVRHAGHGDRRRPDPQRGTLSRQPPRGGRDRQHEHRLPGATLRVRQLRRAGSLRGQRADRRTRPRHVRPPPGRRAPSWNACP